MLTILLQDPKLLLAYEEMEQGLNGNPPVVRLFNRGLLAPYSSLLLIQRKDTLTGAKLFLPLWYSLPLISGIIAFFKNFSRKKKEAKPSAENEADPIKEILEEHDRAEDIRAAAESLEQVLVPEGYSLDSYLKELEDRWSKLIDNKARENLIEDVRSLIRDHLRKYLRVRKKLTLTRDGIGKMAIDIITHNPSLTKLSERGGSLNHYVELYLVKLLGNIR
jgi:hypothetical protein